MSANSRHDMANATNEPLKAVTGFGALSDNQLLTYKQAARYLSVTEPYLRRFKAEGKIPFVPMGTRGVRFRVKSLDEWVERREIK